MSTAALTVSQGTREELQEEHRDALILESDGTVKRFERIDILGTYGASVSEKIRCWLAKEKRISATLAPVSIPLPELKAIVADYVMHGYWDDEGIDQVELRKIATAVESAPDAAALFLVFNLGPIEDALDQL